MRSINKQLKIILIVFLTTVVVAGGFILFSHKDSSAYEVKLPKYYNRPLELGVGDFSLSVIPLNAQAASRQDVEAQDYTVRYNSAYANTDVVQTRETNRLKEDVILKAPGHPAEFSYQLNIKDFDVIKDNDDNFNFYPKGKVDELNKTFTIPAPFMIDADGKQSSVSDVTATLSEQGILTLVPSADWLAQAAYPVTLDPTIEIHILNVHSHPQQGEDWTVEFTTIGKADLYIIPDDQATIDDDEFVSLSCNGEERIPQILPGDIIYYPDWECLPRQSGMEAGDGVAQVVHYTLKAGDHTLRFEFGNEVAYAYNSSWWNSSWSKRRKITFDTTSSATTTNLTNFPAAVQLNSDRIDYASTKAGGQDIRFVEPDDTTEIYYEIEKWDSAATSTFWVKVPQIDMNSNTDYIWMYYGNAAAATSSYATTTGVWDDDFVMVQHLGNTATSTDDFVDSSKYYNHGTGAGGESLAATTTGIVDGAFEFDGSNDNISMPTDPSLSGMSQFTFSAWVFFEQMPATVGSSGGILTKRHNGSPYRSYYFNIRDDCGGGSNNKMYLSTTSDLGGASYWCANTSLATSTWYYVAATWDGSDVHFYLNGVNDDSGGTSYSPTSIYLSDGNQYINYGSNLDGMIDEVRVSKTGRSLEWIEFEYCNNTDSCITYGDEQSNWWNSSWSKRRKITFDTTSSATTTNLTNFPAAVQLNSDRIDYASTKAGGQDIRFVEPDDTTEIYYEIEKWDSAATSTFWVKVPQIDMNSNTDYIWMYYGNAAAATSSYATTTGVWDDNFVGVWHMNNSGSASTTDSTKNGLNGITVGPTATSSGKLGDALEFDGSNDYVNLGNSSVLDMTSAMTFSAWISRGKSALQTIFSKNTSYRYRLQSSDVLSNYIWTDGATSDLGDTSGGTPLDQWVYITGTYDSTNGGELYINKVAGSAPNHGSGNISTTTEDVYIGALAGSSRYLEAIVDEIRLSNVIRSLDWIEFEYCNMNDGCTTYGAAESANYSPVISSIFAGPNPVNVGDDVSFNLSWSDDNGGDLQKAFICKTDAITTSTPACTGANWAYSTSATSASPIVVSYTAQVGDIGSNNYYAFVCDNSGDADTACSNSTAKTFSVYQSTNRGNVQGSFNIKGGAYFK